MMRSGALVCAAACCVLAVMVAGAVAAEGGLLTLERALALAAAASPELDAAAAHVTAAHERSRQQGAWPNPAAFLDFEGAPASGDAWRDADRVLGIEQILPWSGRLSADRAAARHRARGAVAERDLADRSVAAAVRRAYARTAYVGEVAVLRREIVEASRRTVTIVEARLATGGVAADEVAQARYELAIAELEVARTAAELVAARADLAMAVGIDAEELPELADRLGASGGVPDLDVLLAGLEASPILRFAAARADVGDAEARAVSRSRLPDLGLTLGMRRFGGGGDALDAGVRIDVPLFDRGGARTAAARADAVADNAQLRFARLDLERRVRGLHARLLAADAAARMLVSDLRPAADAVLNAAERRYTVGDSELSEVLRMRASWTERRLAELEMRLELDLVRAELNALF